MWRKEKYNCNNGFDQARQRGCNTENSQTEADLTEWYNQEIYLICNFVFELKISSLKVTCGELFFHIFRAYCTHSLYYFLFY